MALVALVCLAVFLYLCYVYLMSNRKGRFPVGPPGIPLFGNALQFETKTALLQMGELGKSYGDAFTLKFFSKPAVVLNSYDMIQEALNSPKFSKSFSGRPESFAGKYVFQNDEIFATYSEEWYALRKLVFKGLKMYGSNMADVEELVQGEIKYLMGRIQNEAGRSVDPFSYISGYFTSVISMLITGQHLKQEDPQLQLLGQITTDLNQVFEPGNLQMLTLMPWLRFIPLGIGKVFQGIHKDLVQLKTIIDEARRNPSKDRKPCFLDFMHQEKEKGHMTEDNVTGVMMDLLGAGTATSRVALYSMFLILTARPDVQKRVQDEIDEVVGRSRLPCNTDKPAMPYTQAVLWESFRLYPSIPITIPHSTIEDVKIRDYFLPKDTQIFYNIWLVLHDEKFWEDPYVFNPSRFLDDAGDLIPPEDERRQRTITFGLGKRMCIGEGLARLRIFLALTSVLQNFTLLPDPDQPLPDTDPRTFLADSLLQSPKYKIIFQSRCPQI